MWSKLKDIFFHAEVTAKEDIIKVFGQGEVKALETTLEGWAKTAFGQVCVAAVQAAKGLASGTEAHGAAFTQITSAMSSAGTTVEQSLVHLGIEMALQFVRGTFGNVL